jgi:putative beta-barrel porin
VKRGGLYFLLFLAHGINAQILDDSTKLVYGPTTTQYIYEDNIKYNDLYFNTVDTSIFNIHRYTTTELSQYQLQDLGVIGTATRSIYTPLPTIIGARSGFSAYEPFFLKPEDFKYYDTKSPYSRIGAAIGGNRRSRVDVGFNRSDSSNFNVGIDYNRVIADKQTSSIGRSDRLTDSEGYDVYMLYFTPNRKYLALTNFSRNKSTSVDQGGIDTTGGFDYFDSDAPVFLQNAKSEYLRRNIHFYHQFNADSAFQFYQTFDRSYASAKFRDDNLAAENDYFDQFNFSIDSTSEENIFITNTLETGVKGTIGKLFYLGYYKIRGYDFTYNWGESDTLNFRTLKPQTNGIEHYVGGSVRIQLNRKYKLTGSVDFNFNGNQRITGDLLAKNFDVRFILQQHAPSFMQRAFLGNHDFWINDFKNIKTLEVEGGYIQKVKKSFIRPNLKFKTITDYVYYNELAMPAQVDGTTTFIQPGLDFSFNFLRHFYLSGKAIYNLSSGSTIEAYPIPDLMLNFNFYYHNLLFEDNLELQVGLDNHWKSDYFAPDYRVSTNQYFIQQRFEVPAYLISDAYLSIKLGHAYVFAKFNNLVQVFTGAGYFAAPDYIGKRPLFDFGFYWMFFD